MKLVKEHINFERGLDPKEAMGTGKYSKAVKIMSSNENFMCLPILEVSNMEKQVVFPEYVTNNLYQVEILSGERKNKTAYVIKFDTPFGDYWGMEVDFMS